MKEKHCVDGGRQKVRLKRTLTFSVSMLSEGVQNAEKQAARPEVEAGLI